MGTLIVLLKSAILGVIEGITEFLPISSTGHMIIADRFIQLSQNAHFVAAFEVIIQFGAVLSIIVLFWGVLWPFGKGKEEFNKKIALWSKILIAFIPAAVLGYKFDSFIEEKLFNPLTVSVALIFYGIILIIIESFNKKRKTFSVETVLNVSYPFAFLIGIFQCLAMVPGTSRSAATIIGGMLLGLSRTAAAEFSFFLAVPTMLGASGLKIYKSGLSFSRLEWAVIAFGFVVSFLTALAVVKMFMDYIQKHDFKIFGYYRIVLGIIVLFLLFR